MNLLNYKLNLNTEKGSSPDKVATSRKKVSLDENESYMIRPFLLSMTLLNFEPHSLTRSTTRHEYPHSLSYHAKTFTFFDQ